MIKNDKYINTHIHPKQDNIKVLYEVEYTEKDENIKDDYSNVKKLKPNDLEQMIELVFGLRMRGKYNIKAYYLIEGQSGWFVEDYCNDIEQIKMDDEKRKINNLIEISKEQEKELEFYREFLKKYNAEKEFEKFKKENRELTA